MQRNQRAVRCARVGGRVQNRLGHWAAFARFVATQATTLAGLALKTSAIFYFEDQTRRAWRGTVNEQKQLEPDQQILLTLRRDLLRIARLPDDFALEYAEAAEQYFSTAECW